MNTDATTYKVLKLLNGEELICELEDDVVDGSYFYVIDLRDDIEILKGTVSIIR